MSTGHIAIVKSVAISGGNTCRGRKSKLLGREDNVIYFYNLGMSIRMIASELDVSRSCVHRFLKSKRNYFISSQQINREKV